MQKLQANANAEEEPIAAPAIARLIQNAKDSLAGDGPSFTKKYKILKDEHAAILSIRKLISLLKTKERNSSAIQQFIKDAKDCLNLAYDDPLFQEKYRALNTKYKVLSKIQEIATSLATFYQAEAKNISEAAEKAIKKLQDIVNEFPQDANSSLEETAKKLSEGIQNYEAARKEHLKVRKIKVSYESRSRTNPERLAVIEAMLKMTDELFDGTMTVNDFQNSVADRQQDVRDSHANSCFTLFGTKSRLAEAIEKEYPSPDLEPGAPIPGH